MSEERVGVQWPVNRCVFLLVFLAAPLSHAATGLPFTSSFENATFAEWDGGLEASLSVTSTDATDGRFSAEARVTRGQVTDNYKDYVFGDHVRVSGDPVSPATGIWLRFDSKFDFGFAFGSTARLHKIAIINFEDENGRRRYQVLINVSTLSREYVLEHLKWNADRSFNTAFPGFPQNISVPAQARLGEWDRLVLFVRPNTPGNLDGEVRFWVNGVLKADHRGAMLREDSTYNPNKLIMSNYVTDTTTEGTQRWDNFYLGETSPEPPVRPMPPRSVTVE